MAVINLCKTAPSLFVVSVYERKMLAFAELQDLKRRSVVALEHNLFIAKLKGVDLGGGLF